MDQYDVVIIGTGIAGMQAGLDLAEKGHKILMVEKRPSIGGKMIQLSKVFPTLDCSSCITTPIMNNVDHHENITTLVNSEVVESRKRISSNTFELIIKKKATFVDNDKCTACGSCESACPVEVPSEFDMGLNARKSIYIPFQTAIPQKAILDLDHCISCGACYKACPAEAINFSQVDQDIEVEAKSVLIATGFELTPLGEKEEYGGGKFENVISSLTMERILAPNGPYQGVRRPSDGKVPMRIAYVQCAGSRDQSLGRPYCSRICCMYAIKQSMLISGALPIVSVTVYNMDIRAFGKGYQQFYDNAKDMGIEFVKGKVAKIKENPDTKDLTLSVERIEADGGLVEEEYDLVVLSLGVVPSENPTANIEIKMDSDGFINLFDPIIDPQNTNVEGIFSAGMVNGPKDIVDSILDSSSAAMFIDNYLRLNHVVDNAQIHDDKKHDGKSSDDDDIVIHAVH